MIHSHLELIIQYKCIPLSHIHTLKKDQVEAHGLSVFERCFENILNAFSELAEYRAFELSAVRSGKQRGDYILTNQVRMMLPRGKSRNDRYLERVIIQR